MLGSVLFGPVTWGRVLVVILHIAMTIIGVNAEEKMLMKTGG